MTHLFSLALSVPENHCLNFKRILIKYMTIQYTSTLSFSAWEDSHETQINLEDFNILLLNCSHAREPWWISRSQFRKYIIRLISVFSHWRSRFLSSAFYRSVVLSCRITPGTVFSEIKFTTFSNKIKIRWLKNLVKIMIQSW